ncbi:MAG: nucleotidyltransferase domain-containing protein, partial [Bacteroidales bacterium]|nr:nucleotidyltransferase domain-containing protein [Bacteroidales bacterium]
MVQSEVIKKLKSIAAEILPENSTLYLYGSRARGTARPDSDWDLLLLLDSETVTSDDYDMT